MQHPITVSTWNREICQFFNHTKPLVIANSYILFLLGYEVEGTTLVQIMLQPLIWVAKLGSPQHTSEYSSVNGTLLDTVTVSELQPSYNIFIQRLHLNYLKCDQIACLELTFWKRLSFLPRPWWRLSVRQMSRITSSRAGRTGMGSAAH